jgi:isovaleryl-CoA dehydrogenase
VALSYGAHSNLCVNQIKLNGTDAQKRHICRALSPGGMSAHWRCLGQDRTLCPCPQGGTPKRSFLNGTKYWITNGAEADTLVVYAKTDPAAGSKGITAFLIRKNP